jgi:tetratricopeptide (TPR) repeat protein
MAIFGVPVVHEDDALRAVRAASELQSALAPMNVEFDRDHGVALQLRTGVNTGEVVTGTAERLATGDAINVAARLQQLAPPGEVLLGDATVRLVRDAVVVDPLGPVELKGKSGPVAAFRLVAVDPSAPATVRRLDAPLVGRADELQTLRAAFARVVREQACGLFTLLGPAGGGKSRLVQELLSSLDATVLRGHCLSYGEGITYFPVVEIVRRLEKEDLPSVGLVLESQPAVSAGLDAIVGVSEAAATSADIAWAFRKVLEAAAATRPVVVVFDDLHWGEPTLFDLVEHVTDLSRSAPILLLCVARPELMERRPGWGGGRLNATALLLEPLADDESDQLIDSLVEGPAGLDDTLRAKVRRVAGGNPLFVEEMLRYLSDGASTSGTDVPPTIHALLAARLDQLDAADRSVLERGSVEGQSFHRKAVEALGEAGGELASRLVGLVRKDLLRPDRATLPGDDAFRFRHLLIRDAAYDSLPKSTRAGLHERFAEWLADTAPDLPELDEILGYHLEMAVQYRASLGPLDDGSWRLALAGCHHLELAGRRALDRGDVVASLNLLTRAAALRPSEDIDIALELAIADALVDCGRMPEAVVRSAGAAEVAASSGQEIVALTARLTSARWGLHVETERSSQELAAVVEHAGPLLERAGDDSALAHYWLAVFDQYHHACRWGVGLDAALRAVSHAEAAGHVRLVRQGRIIAAAAAMLGPMPVNDAIDLITDFEAASTYYEPWFDQSRAELLAMSGRFGEARSRSEQAVSGFAERGSNTGVTLCGMGRWIIETTAGAHADAERVIRGTCEQFEQMGELAWLSTSACYLAESLCRLGRYEEAEEWARRALELGSEDDIATQLGARMALAKLAARRGEHDEALDLARRASELAGATECPTHKGETSSALAVVLHFAGRVEEARAAAGDGIAHFLEKGATALADLARQDCRQAGVIVPEITEISG